MMRTLAENLRSLTLADKEHLEYLLNDWTSRLAKVAQNDLNRQIALTDDIEGLHWLMTQPDWMQAHVTNTGHYGDFLRDVRLAWGVAEKAATLRPEMIGRQVRYALLQTSINSLATNLLPQVLIAGLRLGRWSAKTALVYARQITEVVLRITALIQIGAFLREQYEEELAHEVFTEALAGLREIEYPSNYVEALLALAPHVPPNLLINALAATQEIADAEERAKVMGALAPQLPADLFFEALEIVRAFENSDSQALALAGLAPYLPQSLMQDTLEIIQDSYGTRGTARMLIALIPYLPPELILEAQLIANTIYKEYYRTAALLAFPQHWNPSEKLQMARQALMEARDAADIDDRAEGIVLLAPYLPPELLPEAVAIARAIGDREVYDVAYRTRALVALTPRLSEELQGEVIAEIRSWHPFFFFNRSEVLSALAPHLSERLMSQALDLAFARDVISQGDNTPKRKKQSVNEYPADQIPGALASLVRYLPLDLMSEAWTNVKEIPVADARADALIVLVPYLPEHLLSDSLEIAHQIDGSLAKYRAVALATLAERRIPGAFDEAIQTTQQVQEADESIVVLPVFLAAGAMLPSPQQRLQFIDEALKAAREINEVRYRAVALIELLECPPLLETYPQLLKEALSTARKIRDPRARFQILCRLVRYLPPEQRSAVVGEILKSARKVDFGAEENNSIVGQALLLPLLSPYLPPELLQQALKAARSVHHPVIRGRSLAILAPHLSPTECPRVLNEALQAAREIDIDDTGRFEVLALVVPNLPADQRLTVLEETFAAARGINRMNFSFLGPPLATLVPYIPPQLCSAALELAREIWSPHALVALVPQVPSKERQEVLDEALVASRAIKAPLERAHLLSILLPQVAPDRQFDILEEALNILQQVDFPVNLLSLLQTFSALASIWVKLPQEQALVLWQSILRTYTARQRTYLLAVLAGLTPVIIGLGGEGSLREMLSSVLEVCRRWLWL